MRAEMEEIDALLARARMARPDVPASLMARVLADAHAAQAAFQPAVQVPPPRRTAPRWLDRFARGIPALSGLVAATLAGVWIGFAAPGSVAVFADNLVLGDAGAEVELIPDYSEVFGDG
jgi:hypothetical protein